MPFTSLQWVGFLLLAFTAHQLTPPRHRRGLLLAASVVFYASWSVRHLALIAFQILVDWTCGWALGRTDDERRRKSLVAVSVVANVGVLAVFKYWGLFARTIESLGGRAPIHHLVLPLAISFYTFESLSYTVDVYRRTLKPLRSPLDLALFITWFPHLVAGPIVRPAQLVPQFGAPQSLTAKTFWSAVLLMLIGYGKKLLGADWLALVVDPVFARPTAYTSLEIAIAVYAYAFQIYLDFSAYTDIARGASRLFGIELPENFLSPYSATSITDFWRRWHVTLSRWLKDYLYIPLGGNRRGRARTYANVMVTMLVGGLWHGASWTFVVWGAVHGIVLVFERVFGLREEPRGAARLFRQLVTFHIVCFAWILFRAPTFAVAADVYRGLARFSMHIAHGRVLASLGAIVIILTYLTAKRLRPRLLDWEPPQGRGQVLYAAFVGGFLLVIMTLGAWTNAFIYFQF